MKKKTLGKTAFLSRDVEDVVSSNEGIPIFVLELTVHVLLALLQSDVHVAVQTGQYT